MLLDCGTPSTIIGLEDFKQILRQYTPMIQSKLRYRQSNKRYEFGGGRKTYSLGKVRLPVYVIDNERNPHLLHVWIEILNQLRLPLLLGNNSLLKVNGTLSFGEKTLTIDWEGKRLCLPIDRANSGHFHLQFFPMSQTEENHFMREMVSMADWSQEETEKVIAYIAKEKRPQIDKIKRPGILKKYKGKKPLSKQQVDHLHQSLGHIHPEKVKGLVKRTKMWNNNTMSAIDDLNRCKTCVVECNEKSVSKEAGPKTIGHNHILAIDLRQNLKYRNAPPFILYLCDTFSKLKVACFLNDKESATIAQHLVTEWIKYHGPPKYIMGNKDAEIFKGEVKELCLLQGIHYTNTAVHASQQNEFSERGHAVADRALERMLIEDPSLDPRVALSWVTHAANSLQNVYGCVPFQLVFGKIPKHPSLAEDNPGANETLANSQTQWAKHYRAMIAAREHYIAAETDPALRETLKRQLLTEPTAVNKGDWIYYRRIRDKHWKGPAKLVSKEDRSLHCTMLGNPLIIDMEDIHINKSNVQEMELEDLIYIPNNQQSLVRPAMPDRHSREQKKETTDPEGALEVPTSLNTGSASTPQQYDTQNPSEQVSQEGTEARIKRKTGSWPSGSSPPIPNGNNKHEAEKEDLTSHQPVQNPANSTTPIDLGFPIICNLCSREISSKNFFRHCSIDHNIERPNFRQHAVKISVKPDSINQNHGKLKPGTVVVSDEGDYIILEQPTILGWNTTNINTKETKDLALVTFVPSCFSFSIRTHSVAITLFDASLLSITSNTSKFS